MGASIELEAMWRLIPMLTGINIFLQQARSYLKDLYPSANFFATKGAPQVTKRELSTPELDPNSA